MTLEGQRIAQPRPLDAVGGEILHQARLVERIQVDALAEVEPGGRPLDNALLADVAYAHLSHLLCASMVQSAAPAIGLTGDPRLLQPDQPARGRALGALSSEEGP